MTPDTLRLALSKKYELVCFENLDSFVNDHSSLFKFLQSKHQSKFTDRQRLVFYSNTEPEQELLNHVQRSVKSNNIGNFFVIIYSPYDITEKLTIARDKFNWSDIVISSINVPLNTSQHKAAAHYLQNFDNICALPFASLSVFNNAAVPCCKFKSDPIDEITSETLGEIFVSARMRQIRTTMFKGNKLKECDTCWNHEAIHNSSLRKYYLEKYEHQLDFELLDNPQLVELQIAPSIVCNFSCRICNAMTSSKIATEEFNYATTEEEAKSIKDIIRLSSKQNQQADSLLLNNMQETFKNIRTLRLVGGEPFLWSNLESFLTGLINLNYAKNIRLEFNTNGSVYPSSIIELIKKFKQVEILISIDAVGEKFEIQRGGQWHTVDKNIKLFSQLKNDNFIVKLSPTVNIQNVLYLEELVEYAQMQSYEIVWWYLENPEYLCIDNVTSAVKELIFTKYSNHHVSELCDIALRVNQTNPVTGKKFIDYMKKLDQRRAQNFRESHVEIYDAMASE